jgi:hypothetical protein
VFRFSCKACGAKRDVRLPCEPDKVELYGSFVRCPACMRTDGGNWALYWGLFAVKVVALTGVLAAVAALTMKFVWVLPPLAPIALWADHRSFMRKLDLIITGATVSGGRAGERLPRP